MAEFAIETRGAQTSPIQTVTVSIVGTVTPPLAELPIITLRTTWRHHTTLEKSFTHNIMSYAVLKHKKKL